MKTLFLSSPTLDSRIIIDLTQGPAKLAETKKNPSEYRSGLSSPLAHQGAYMS